MNSTHLHLIITHLPIFASLIGALVLAYGMWRRSNETENVAYLIFIIAALGAGISYLTGEAAEEVAEKIPGVSEKIIEQHEQFAIYALISLIVLGLASLISLIVIYRKNVLSKHVSTAVLLISLVSFVLIARTGYLGGQIRHSEISSANAQNYPGSEEHR